MDMDDNHMDLWKSEIHETERDRAWMRWADRVEDLLGHDLDGSLAEDGYALDFAYDLFSMGLTPEGAVARIERNKEYLRRKRFS